MSEKFISVVIPTWNRKNLLRRCLKSLLSQTYPINQYEIIVVDDGSADGTDLMVQEIMKNSLHEVRYFKQVKKGAAAARNMGIRNAKGEIIAFIDDDCIASKEWLEKMANAFLENPTVLGVEGKTVSMQGCITPFTHQIVNTKGNFFVTCNISYRKDVLNRVGGFDEGYVYPHNEDLDLAFSVLELGEIIFEPRAKVMHPPFKKDFLSLVRRMRFYETDFRLYKKHLRYYRKRKGRTPLLSLIKSVIMVSFFIEVRRHIHWISWRIDNLIKFLALLLFQRIYLLCLLPVFHIRYRLNKNL